jgi:RNAse (barnase) inhibitor barstar
MMNIAIDKNLVEFTPETDAETKNLDALWKVIVDCVKFNKKLVPVGEFVPGKTNVARFAIEE